MSQPAQTLLTEENFSQLLSSSDEIHKRAKVLHENEKALKEALAAQAPIVADELIKYACIEPSARDQAILTLQDPIKTIELVKKLASFHLTRIDEPGKPANLNTNTGVEVPRDQFGRPKSARLIEAETKFHNSSKDWSINRKV